MQPLFRERLVPGFFVLALAAIFGLMMGVIVTPVSVVAGIVVALILAIAFPAVLIASSPVVSVTADRVSAGRAHIEPEFLGSAVVLNKSEFAARLGPDIRPLDFRVTRGWIATGVEVPVIDPQDPTPAWLISLRQPEDFALALAAAQKERAASS